MVRNQKYKSRNSNNVFVRLWMIGNVILGIASGSLLAYESYKNCGDIFTGASATSFLFSFLNLILLAFNNLWHRYTNIFNMCVLMTISVIQFICIYQVYKQSICDNQWCIAKGIDSSEIIDQFQSQDDSDQKINKFCSQDENKQLKILQNLAAVEYQVLLKKDELWYIDNSTPFALCASLASFSLLFSLLLAADTIQHFKFIHKYINQSSLLTSSQS